jgi:hypothetical protein
MKAILTIIGCISIVTAFPSPSDGNESEVNSYYPVKTTGANCQPGQNYCYEQIVRDLGPLKSSPFSPWVIVHNTFAAECDPLLRNQLLFHGLTIIKVSRSRQSSINTATRISGTTRYLVTLARSGRGRLIIAGMVRARGTRYSSVKRGRSTHLRSGVIGVRGANVFDIQYK